MGVKEVVTKGIGAHGMWKRRLSDAIKTGQSEWTPAVVSKDTECEFGKWLHSCSVVEKSSPHYDAVKSLHATFHKTAADVLTLALDKKKAAAEKSIAPGSDYANSSAALTKEMMAWKSDER